MALSYNRVLSGYENHCPDVTTVRKDTFTLAENTTNMFHKFCAFTLAEVLITLGIIGIVAAMTIPTLIQKYQEMQFKIAYKKAFSDLSNAVMSNLAYNNFPYRSATFDSETTLEEWTLLKESFKAVKECNAGDLYSCWAEGDRLCIGCDHSDNPGVPNSSSMSFVDASGRSWAMYSRSENLWLVDTNGYSKPNRFGKDRWFFAFADASGTRVSKGYPAKVRPYYTKDILTSSTWCQHPPCYYYTWLYER